MSNIQFGYRIIENMIYLDNIARLRRLMSKLFENIMQ